MSQITTFRKQMRTQRRYPNRALPANLRTIGQRIAMQTEGLFEHTKLGELLGVSESTIRSWRAANNETVSNVEAAFWTALNQGNEKVANDHLLLLADLYVDGHKLIELTKALCLLQDDSI